MELDIQTLGVPSQKVLEIVMPDITSYPIYANPCAILDAHDETREWLLSCFIQLCSNGRALNFYDFNYATCPFLKLQRISKRLLEEWAIDIIPFLIKSLNSNHYIYILVKSKYINAYYYNNSEAREQSNNSHDMFIYGYDIEQRMFYIADNFDRGKYKFATCSFEEMENAVTGILPQDEKKGPLREIIELMEYIPGWRPDLSIKRVYEALDDYYNCKPTGMWNIMEIRNYNRSVDWYFGINCYEYLANKMNNLQSSKIIIQDFHLMWEHKKHLKKIFEYLLEKEYISDYSVLTRMERIVNNSLIARNIVLKYWISGEQNLVKKVIGIYNQMKEEESKIIFDVLIQLGKCDMERMMWKS